MVTYRPPMASDTSSSAPEHTDVLIIGAGISGIGAAYHLQTMCPDRDFVILEGRQALGGTWDLFRYPGVRSDSDMHTLGFSFRPWRADKAIADGPAILQYLRDTAEEFGIDQRIRYGHRVTAASWDSAAGQWTVTISATSADGSIEHRTMTAGFLSVCTGYYSYRGGHEPEFAGRDDFAGQIVHPQKWPEDLDHAGKRVVVIGSGATAVTLVPAMASTAAHVTMLQRSPTYVVAAPDVDRVANALRAVLPGKAAYAITRWKNLARGQFIYGRTRKAPQKVRTMLLDLVRKEIGDELTDAHFTPSYDPWDQRLCLVPNGDLFESLKSGQASVVTATIDRFVPEGIRLDDGTVLEADLIVTATGLQLVTVGEMDIDVDGEPVDFSETWTYKGLGYSGVPNLVSTFGYINASWTLRADLVAEYTCRLLNHMTEAGASICTPTLRPSDANMPQRPWIEDFSAGYMQRMMPMLPKQGDRAPWQNHQRYRPDKKALRDSPVDDGVMRFSSPSGSSSVAEAPAQVPVAGN